MSDATIKALFLSIPEIVALNPQVVELQAELGEARPLGATRSKPMQKLLDEAAKVDVVHDALVRAVESGVQTDRLCSLARKPLDRVQAERAEQVAGKLLPTGLSIVNASLVAESGNAERVNKLLAREPELATFLEEIVRGRFGRLMCDDERSSCPSSIGADHGNASRCPAAIDGGLGRAFELPLGIDFDGEGAFELPFGYRFRW